MSSKSQVKIKQTALSSEQKIGIGLISELRRQETSNSCFFIRLSKQTVNSIWQNHANLSKAYEAYRTCESKRKHKVAFDYVEIALLKCFTISLIQNVSEIGHFFHKKVQELAKLLKHDSFQCSRGWLEICKVRHHFVFREVFTDTTSAANDVVEDWIATCLPVCLS
jgi:hypothetical protein